MSVNRPGVRYEKATIGDIILSLILPGWGFAIGLIALASGERVRAFTMFKIGGAMLVVYVLLGALARS